MVILESHCDKIMKHSPDIHSHIYANYTLYSHKLKYYFTKEYNDVSLEYHLRTSFIVER